MDEAEVYYIPAYCRLEFNAIERYTIRLPEGASLARSRLWHIFVRKGFYRSNMLPNYSYLLFLLRLLFRCTTIAGHEKIFKSLPVISANNSRGSSIKVFTGIFFLSAGIGI
jgi:hypothetical protein